MPGAHVALDSDGRTVALGSMGMVVIELRDQSGNELNLKEASAAEVGFPIIQEQQGEAPVMEVWCGCRHSSKPVFPFCGENT